MRAAVFEGLGKPLNIMTVPDPEPEQDQVILKVEVCGICGSDLHATDAGVFLQAPGTILGHEFSGVVADSGGSSFKVGTRVTALPYSACGKCDRCREGRGIVCSENKFIGLAKDKPGAFAEYVKVGADKIVPLPDTVSFEEGAMVEPLAVGLHAVDEGQIPIGARVLILGAGPIGLSVTAFARLRGASKVVVSERAPARRDAATRLGATHVIDPAPAEELSASFAKVAGGPPDVIFDCVGAPGTLATCLDVSRSRGTVVVVGVCMKPDTIIPLTGILKELRVQFVLGYMKDDFAKVLTYIDEKRLDPRQMLTQTIDLDQLPTIFETLRNPKGQIKVLVQPASSA